MPKKFNSKTWGDANDMAEYYWAVQIEADPNVHQSLQDDPRKLKVTLHKWTQQFYLLLLKEQPPMDEVEKVIRFIFHSKYYSKARYSAGYLCSKYVAIRELVERIEFQPYTPKF